MYSVSNTLSEYTYQKTLLHTLFCLFLKSLKTFTVSLSYKKVTTDAFGSYMCDALRDLVPFAQCKKHEKHPRRSVTFGKVAGFGLQHIYHFTILKK